jgi:hypothetical protein
MDDRELQRLIRMAIEADDLAAPSDVAGRIRPAAARPPASPVIRWGRWLAAGLTAAAACLAVLLWWPTTGTPPAPPAGPNIATAILPAVPTTELHAPKPAPAQLVIKDVRYVTTPGEQCIVLSIFLGSGGSCRCMQWRSHQWEPGRTLADICPSELLDVAFKSSGACTPNPEHVLILALAGPPGTLPRTRSEAEAVVACVSRANLGDGGSDQDPSVYASAAISCLPTGVRALAESQTLALAR